MKSNFHRWESNKLLVAYKSPNFSDICLQTVQCGTLMVRAQVRQWATTLMCSSSQRLCSGTLFAEARTSCFSVRPSPLTRNQQVNDPLAFPMVNNFGAFNLLLSNRLNVQQVGDPLAFPIVNNFGAFNLFLSHRLNVQQVGDPLAFPMVNNFGVLN